MNKRLKLSIFIYLILVVILVIVKPSYIYNENGTLKRFGTGSNATIVPLWMIILLCGFFAFYCATIIDHLQLFN